MYHIIYIFIFLILSPILKIKAIRKGYDFSFKERFVLYKDSLENCIWIHCASVGELNTAKPVFKFLKEKGFNVVITVSSPRGKKYAQKTYPDAVIRELPFDFVFSVRRFLRVYKPKALIILEEELWYNLVRITSLEIPVFLFNGRISQKSFGFYKFFKRFYKKILQSFKLIACRSKEDEERFKYICSKCNTILCGDLKYISSLDEKDIQINFPKKNLIVAGSTYKKEEEILLKALKNLPDYILVLAPRHIERIKETKKLIENFKHKYELFSETKNVDKNTKVYLIDTLGVLSSTYKYANIAFIGGTIEDIGGHNPLEALLKGIPIIVGKNHYKIKSVLEDFKEFVYIIEDENDILKSIKKIEKKEFSFNIKEKVERIKNCYENILKKYLL
ncbi:MAG TPA: glycosyltransferase [Persephonella sp.]|nr:glycosyltransferase [Persephonella sp.]